MFQEITGQVTAKIVSGLRRCSDIINHTHVYKYLHLHVAIV